MRRNPRELAGLQARTSRRAVLLGGVMTAFAGGLALRMRHREVVAGGGDSWGFKASRRTAATPQGIPRPRLPGSRALLGHLPQNC